MTTKTAVVPFWARPLPELLQQLGSSPEGLTEEETSQRLIRSGGTHVQRSYRFRDAVLLLSQFNSPIVLLLLSAAGLSFFLRNPTDAAIILAIVLMSGLLGYWQERSASHAVERLLAVVRVTAEVVRNGTVHEIPIDEIVPGDIVLLSAGAGVPGDCRLAESKDLFVDEATLTGDVPHRKGSRDVRVGHALKPADELRVDGHARDQRQRPGGGRPDWKGHRIRRHRGTFGPAPARNGI